MGVPFRYSAGSFDLAEVFEAVSWSYHHYLWDYDLPYNWNLNIIIIIDNTYLLGLRACPA